LANYAFAATQTRLFRSAAQQQGQAGLARAPEPEYFSEHVLENLPEQVTHPSATPEALVHDEEAILQKNSISVLQETTKPVVETSAIEPVIDTSNVPAYQHGSKFDRVPYWQNIGRWKNVTEEKFLSYRWGVS